MRKNIIHYNAIGIILLRHHLPAKVLIIGKPNNMTIQVRAYLFLAGTKQRLEEIDTTFTLIEESAQRRAKKGSLELHLEARLKHVHPACLHGSPNSRREKPKKGSSRLVSTFLL